MIPLFVMFAAAILAPATLAAQDTARFQQGIDYRIEAILDESTDVLSGRARLVYTNNSPDTLDTLFFHQYLNAFRPNSAWARRELQFGERRFQDLGPDEHAFARLASARVGGEEVQPVYPGYEGQPDSTVVAIPLPTPLGPGDSVTVRLDWDARLATVPRRQGREGRQYDWAHWYPRIAVYDRNDWQYRTHLPQGEFYGEFASYDVTLDVVDDQVIGATGVPVEGDPGWARVANEAASEIAYQRNAYPDTEPESLGLLSGEAEPGRKRTRWRAENVHHFAWGADPDFVYLEGEYSGDAEAPLRSGPVPIHVLAQAGGDWDPGVALEHTQSALAWLEDIFGPYPYPQLTNLHRIESGGTEFPMMIMDGSDSEGLIVHEVTHQYLHGILANNEWRDGWLDEGFTSFITSWYFEAQGQEDVWDGALEAAAERARAGRIQPVATPGAEFANPSVYSAMTYTKPSLIFRMLRELVGEDTMREILATYYDRYQFQHVTEEDFRAVVEEVSGRNLDWFFEQWLHTTDTLDYGVGDAATIPLPNGRWRTRVEVLRLGDAWMPVTLQVGDETRMLGSRDTRQVVEIVTPDRPEVVVLDPENILLDIDPTNDRAAVGT